MSGENPQETAYRIARNSAAIQREAILWSPDQPFTRPPLLRFRIRTLDWLLNKRIWERCGRDPAGLQLYRLTSLGKLARAAIQLLSAVEDAEERKARG